MVEADGVSRTQHAMPLTRMFFVLPEPISLPEGYQVVMTTGDGAAVPRDDDPVVSLIFHQVSTQGGRSSAAMAALADVISRAPGLPPMAGKWVDVDLAIEWTVVEAMTSAESPDPVPDAQLDDPASWPPRADAFSRCLLAAREVVRSLRQATETPYGLPAYVRAISPVLTYTADGVKEDASAGGQPVVVIRPNQDVWDGPGVMLLDHSNFADPFRGKAFDLNAQLRFEHWHSDTGHHDPLNLWRERWIEARRAHEILGEEGQAVILANTSCEVLLDAVLALLMWDDGCSFESAVPAFEEGKVLRRIRTELTPRLKGNWSTDTGSVGNWYDATYRLRHRVIHAGYSPSRIEAKRALSAGIGLQRFVMDRIACRRMIYPRAALMTLGEEGLQRRGLWSGKIKRFAEEEARTEVDWRKDYSAWYREVVAALE